VLGGWVAFTLSLAGWLFYFSSEQIARIQSLGGAEIDQAVRYQRMLLWETTVLLASLLGGALTIAILMIRNQENSRRIKNFFLTFTHELKTPLASIQLQAESLAEDLGDSEHKPVLDRLSRDASRLAIQLENSLYLAEGTRGDLHLEPVSIPEDMEYLLLGWPGMKVSLNGSARIKVDKRAFESIVRNILKNAVDHGGATEMIIYVAPDSADAKIDFRDNGRGFSGDLLKLGELFSASSSGNGIGLHLIKKLAQRMGGEALVKSTSPNFCVSLTLPRI
jgi:signal transduction histidine kinase